MSFPRPAALAALVFGAALAAGCSTASHVADLARNDELYHDVPFTTKAPGDRPAFVAPLVDARSQEPLPTQSRGFPITYGNDQVWERPVVEMVGEVLQRQLEASQLFPEVTAAAAPTTLVVVPSLVSFLSGAAEAIAGSSSFAEVGLRLQVFGPADGNGKRALLHDAVYGNRQATEAGLSPISPYRLLGRALQVSVGKALAGLDGSNVARSNVPLGVAVPVPASATK